MTPDDFKSNVLASPQVRAIADHSHDGRRWMMPSRLATARARPAHACAHDCAHDCAPHGVSPFPTGARALHLARRARVQLEDDARANNQDDAR